MMNYSTYERDDAVFFTKKRIILLSFLIFISYFILLVSTTKQQPFPDVNAVFYQDYWDREIYFLRGSWYPLKKAPYKDVFLEYPPLAAYLFATPFIFMPKTDISAMQKYFNSDSFLSSDWHFPITPPSVYKSRYMVIFSFLMAIFGLFTVRILLFFLSKLNKEYQYTLFFLLPPMLFYIFSRFDILPALLTLGAAYCAHENKYGKMAILLGLAVTLKAYAISLLPVFFVFLYYKKKKELPLAVFLFLATFFLVCLPAILMASPSAIWGAGRYLLGRNCNNESLYYLISIFFDNFFASHEPIIDKIFLVLSFGVIPFAISAKIDDTKLLLKWCLLTLYVFLLFLKFYSPQWILWVIFFMILTIESKKDIVNIILFQVITWLIFPVADIIYRQPSYPFVILVTLKTVLLASLAISLGKELLPSSKVSRLFCKNKIA